MKDTKISKKDWRTPQMNNRRSDDEIEKHMQEMEDWLEDYYRKLDAEVEAKLKEEHEKDKELVGV